MCTGSPLHSPPVGSTAAEERVHEQVSVKGGRRGRKEKGRGGEGRMVIRD